MSVIESRSRCAKKRRDEVTKPVSEHYSNAPPSGKAPLEPTSLGIHSILISSAQVMHWNLPFCLFLSCIHSSFCFCP